MNFDEIKRELKHIPKAPWSWDSSESETGPFTIYRQHTLSKDKRVPLFQITPLEDDSSLINFVVKAPFMLESLVKLLEETQTKAEELKAYNDELYELLQLFGKR